MKNKTLTNILLKFGFAAAISFATVSFEIGTVPTVMHPFHTSNCHKIDEFDLKNYLQDYLKTYGNNNINGVLAYIAYPGSKVGVYIHNNYLID